MYLFKFKLKYTGSKSYYSYWPTEQRGYFMSIHPITGVEHTRRASNLPADIKDPDWEAFL